MAEGETRTLHSIQPVDGYDIEAKKEAAEKRNANPEYGEGEVTEMVIRRESQTATPDDLAKGVVEDEDATDHTRLDNEEAEASETKQVGNLHRSVSEAKSPYLYR